MIDSLANSHIEDYDNYNRKTFRRNKKRRFRRRRPPIRFNNNGFPVKVKIPTKKQPKIVKGRPTKLPPITNFRKNRNTGVVKPGMLVKNVATTKTKTPIPTKKIGIDTLIKKTATKSQAPPQPQIIKKQSVVANQQEEKQAVNKAVESDNRVGKMIKVVTGIAIAGAISFGIYKYIQHRKKHNIKLKKSA